MNYRGLLIFLNKLGCTNSNVGVQELFGKELQYLEELETYSCNYYLCWGHTILYKHRMKYCPYPKKTLHVTRSMSQL